MLNHRISVFIELSVYMYTLHVCTLKPLKRIIPTWTQNLPHNDEDVSLLD